MIVVALFWLGVSTIVYTFIGYPALITTLARLRPRAVASGHIEPTVSLFISAYNEAAVIRAKIENSLALDYPKDRLRIVVVADGSTDQTQAIAAEYPEIEVFFQSERLGKAAALNRVIPLVGGEVIVITDANAMLEPGSIRAMVAHFADDQVAGVAGEKRVLDGGESLYWRYESYLKRCDSQVSSVMGAAGELYAVRRRAYKAVEDDSILDDFVTSMRLVEDGWRVVYEPQATASEGPSPSLKADWERRARNAAGGIQSIIRLAGLLHPRHGLVTWQYVSHRVLRWSVTPFTLPMVFLLNLLLLKEPWYWLPMAGQLLFYGIGFLGYLRARKGRNRGLSHTIFYFCFSNLAAVAGFGRYVTGRQSVLWRRVRG